MKFEELNFRPHPNYPFDGIQAIKNFPNGFGVSVVRTPHSYAYKDGVYELAVLKNGKICYDSGIIDDVIGCLNPIEVEKLLSKVEQLEKEE